MKTVITFIIMLLGFLSMVAAQDKRVIVRYPPGTPQSAIEAAMQSIKDAGGEARPLWIINGFSAVGPAAALLQDEITTQSNGYSPTIEEDGIMTIQNQV